MKRDDYDVFLGVDIMELEIIIDRSSSITLYMQIYNGIRDAILKHALRPDDRLDSIMELKDKLSVSRNTVEIAYQQLLAEGFIFSIGGSGYYVSELDEFDITSKHCTTTDKDYPINSLHINNKHFAYDFKPGSVDESAFPFKEWRKIEQDTMKTNDILSYSDPRGEEKLRIEIANYLKKSRHVYCSIDQIIVGAGTQTLIFLLSHLLDDKYERICAMEEPGFTPVRKAFEWCNYRIETLPICNDGIDLDHVRNLDIIPSYLYVTPSNQHPTGSLMPIKYRIDLINWATRNNVYLIEDDYDSEYRYNVQPVPSLYSLDQNKQVIYIGTFSKTLFPALHVGYVVLPDKLISNYIRQAHFINQTASKIHQLTIASFMESGMFEKHIKRMRNIYKRKNSYIVKELIYQLGNKIKIIGHSAGVNLCIEVLNGMDEHQLIKTAEEVGVRVYPISYYYHDKNNIPMNNNTVFLGYGHLSTDDISRGITLLKNAWF